MTVVGASIGSDVAYSGGGARMYQRLIWTAANTWKFQWSYDGTFWMTHSSGARTLTPTHFGLNVSTWGGGTQRLATWDYFRVTEADLSL